MIFSNLKKINMKQRIKLKFFFSLVESTFYAENEIEVIIYLLKIPKIFFYLFLFQKF